MNALHHKLEEVARLFQQTGPIWDTTCFELALHDLVLETCWWEEVLESARRGQHGEWVVNLGDHHHDARQKLAFMLDVGEAMEER